MTSLEVFFELLRAGTWGREAIISNAPPSWSEVIEIAKRQSVVGVIYDGVQTLSKDVVPERKHILDLFAITHSIEVLNKRTNMVVAQLVAYLNEHGVSSRLMKGQGCALLYPNPLHRHSGDIDLFVGAEQYQFAKELIENKGIDIEKEEVYDAHFMWRNVPVELHWLETKLYYPKNNGSFQQICRKEEWANPVVAEIEGQSVEMFNCTFNTFYVFVHLYHHFLQVGVGLRQVCDWMLLLKRYECEIDWNRLHEYIRAIKAERAWKAFYGLAVERLGLQLVKEPIWMQNRNSADIQFVMNDILNVGNFGQYGASLQKRAFGKGLMVNVSSFVALITRLFKVNKFGCLEAFSYPLWRLFCDRSLFERYKF